MYVRASEFVRTALSVRLSNILWKWKIEKLYWLCTFWKQSSKKSYSSMFVLICTEQILLQTGFDPFTFSPILYCCRDRKNENHFRFFYHIGYTYTGHHTRHMISRGKLLFHQINLFSKRWNKFVKSLKLTNFQFSVRIQYSFLWNVA